MPKRANGEGNIRLRKDGRWEARYSYVDDAGKRHRKSLMGHSQREVKAALAAAVRAVEQGRPPSGDRLTVAEFLDRWLAEVVAPTLRPKTRRFYGQMVRLYLAPGLGHHRLAKLTPQQVQATLNALAATGLAPRTVAHARAVLRQALGKAEQWGLVARNAAALADAPQVEEPEPRVVAPAEARRLLDAARDDRLAALYSVALALGLREGEILGLRWADVDLAAGTLRVEVQLQRVDGAPRLVPLKTRRSRRTLHLPEVCAAALKAHRVRLVEERLLAGERWRGGDWDLVFPTRVGTPIDARNLVRSFKALLTRAGIPDMRFHDLRHACTSLLIAQGIPARVVMETLGHSQIGVTLNRYAHVAPEVQKEAARAMDRLFGAD